MQPSVANVASTCFPHVSRALWWSSSHPPCNPGIECRFEYSDGTYFQWEQGPWPQISNGHWETVWCMPWPQSCMPHKYLALIAWHTPCNTTATVGKLWLQLWPGCCNTQIVHDPRSTLPPHSDRLPNPGQTGAGSRRSKRNKSTHCPSRTRLPQTTPPRTWHR